MDLLSVNPYYFEDFGYKHIMVDEFQDCNDLQLEIVKKLMDTPFFESLMVVGDDSQSIFGFRGSDPRIIINFWDKLGEEGEDFFLLENHRSTPEIIDFANKVNELNVSRVSKNLIATRASGKPVMAEGFWKKEEVYEYFLNIIKDKIKEGMQYEDIAYIASTRVELMNMGSYLTEHNIPWIMLNPEPMLENSSVLAALSLAEFFNDDTATKQAFTYVNSCLDNKMLEKMTDDEVKNVIGNLATKVADIKAKNDIDGYKELVDALDHEDEIFESFKNSLFLRTTLEDVIKYSLDYLKFGKKQAKRRDLNYPGVVLTTAHSSKGMEWPVVVNNISKYHSRNLSRSAIEETRRLLFVSSTRARDELYIIGQKVAFGSKNNRTYNKFLVETFHILGKEFSTIEPVAKKEKKKKKGA